MPSKVTSYLTFCFCFAFWSFMVVHYAHMKSSTQYREIASWSAPVKPWYDASFKQ